MRTSTAFGDVTGTIYYALGERDGQPAIKIGITHDLKQGGCGEDADRDVRELVRCAAQPYGPNSDGDRGCTAAAVSYPELRRYAVRKRGHCWVVLDRSETPHRQVDRWETLEAARFHCDDLNVCWDVYVKHFGTQPVAG